MKKVYYIIYEVEENGDLSNKYESTNTKNICKWLNINVKHINRYFINDIENIDKPLKDEKYFIFKEID